MFCIYVCSGRVFADILTLGLAEISRATAGHANHWAFVAKAANLDIEVSPSPLSSSSGSSNV